MGLLGEGNDCRCTSRWLAAGRAHRRGGRGGEWGSSQRGSLSIPSWYLYSSLVVEGFETCVIKTAINDAERASQNNILFETYTRYE